MEKEKLKFKLDTIPERFGGGYKAHLQLSHFARSLTSEIRVYQNHTVMRQ